MFAGLGVRTGGLAGYGTMVQNKWYEVKERSRFFGDTFTSHFAGEFGYFFTTLNVMLEGYCAEW